MIFGGQNLTPILHIEGYLSSNPQLFRISRRSNTQNVLKISLKCFGMLFNLRGGA